jgi:HPt (histidine-containing phosphotransfer) domain-containing protein
MAETFDEAELMDRLDNDVEFLAETVEMLTGDGPGLMSQIQDAIASGDAATLGRVAHTLKGMISNFCAPAAQNAALELERMGKAGDLSAAPAATTVLQVQVDALIAELEQFVKSRSS